MTNASSHYTLLINSLLSNKEIKINTNNTLKITESSVFKNAKTIIPIDLIETQAKKGSRLDYQWVIFGLVCFIAASMFTLLALTQQFTSVLILGTIFTVIGCSAIFLAYKFKSITHTYQYKGTGIKLFTLTENDLNESQISEFVTSLNSSNETIDNDIVDSLSALKSPSAVNKTSAINSIEDKLNTQVEEYYQHLDFLYEAKIIGNRLMLKLQKKAYDKVYGVDSVDVSVNTKKTSNTQKQDNVILFPITGT